MFFRCCTPESEFGAPLSSRRGTVVVSGPLDVSVGPGQIVTNGAVAFPLNMDHRKRRHSPVRCVGEPSGNHPLDNRWYHSAPEIGAAGGRDFHASCPDWFRQDSKSCPHPRTRWIGRAGTPDSPCWWRRWGTGILLPAISIHIRDNSCRCPDCLMVLTDPPWASVAGRVRVGQLNISGVGR